MRPGKAGKKKKKKGFLHPDAVVVRTRTDKQKEEKKRKQREFILKFHRNLSGVEELMRKKLL